MATQATPVELAKELIAVLVEAGLKPGEGMPTMSARTMFGPTRTDDFAAAVDYAQQAGWITRTPDGFWITLTQEGFDEA